MLAQNRFPGSRGSWLSLLVLLSVAVTSLLAAEREQPKRYTRGVVIRFEGMITPLREQYVYRKLEVARNQGADLIVLEIDSPGGFLEPSLDLAAHFRDLRWAHTVAYVPRQALSGAAILALGCDEIVMHPHATLGDAGPIYQGEGGLFRHAPEKLRSDLARRVRDLAEAKNRPPGLAEAMVDMNLVVYEVRHKENGNTWFLSEHELEANADAEQYEKVRPVLESREGHFLEVSGRRAVDLKLASATVGSREELARRYRLENGFLVLRPTIVDTAVVILNNPFVTGLLFLIGLVALYFEFSSPGISIGGLLAGLCFALFFWSRFMGATSGWLEIILFVSGLIFLGVELFVLPGFGVAGLTGLLLILASIIMASQDFVVPQTSRDLATMGRTLLVVLVAGIAAVIAMVSLSRYYSSLPILNRLVLAPPASEPAAEHALAKSEAKETAPAVARRVIQVGDLGTTDSALRPAGKAVIGDDYVDVVTEGLFVEQGRPVRVVQVQGNRIVVREVDA